MKKVFLPFGALFGLVESASRFIGRNDPAPRKAGPIYLDDDEIRALLQEALAQEHEQREREALLDVVAR
ncbi:MAG: hypothetical protein ETSY1_37670 [Candidatus Entotheonella factor]|uniref:Uncharacterized protein n=1 Tax=Entotheonella factor TaxID=1429438 RepID=W4L7D3_ENTF1|nr:MAG: hypothetical protein ETSY1_37670 [Candidatus Entotheonella factor]